MDGKRCGHCPTCSDFETLWQTVEDLKKQVHCNKLSLKNIALCSIAALLEELWVILC